MKCLRMVLLISIAIAPFCYSWSPHPFVEELPYGINIRRGINDLRFRLDTLDAICDGKRKFTHLGKDVSGDIAKVDHKVLIRAVNEFVTFMDQTSPLPEECVPLYNALQTALKNEALFDDAPEQSSLSYWSNRSAVVFNELSLIYDDAYVQKLTVVEGEKPNTYEKSEEDIALEALKQRVASNSTNQVPVSLPDPIPEIAGKSAETTSLKNIGWIALFFSGLIGAYLFIRKRSSHL